MVYVLGSTFMLIPGIVALVIDKRAGRRVRSSLWIHFRPNRWWIVAWLSPVFLALAALGAALLLPNIGFDPGMDEMLRQLESMLSEDELAAAKEQLNRFPFGIFLFIAILQGLGAGATINAFFALGEELGWRGLMLRELAHKGFWTSAAIIGVVWGVWHAPLILQGHNYPDNPMLGVFAMTIFCLLLSPLFSWVTLKCRSVIAAAIMHGTLNATGALSIIFLDNFADLVVGITGAVGLSILLVLNIALYFFARPTLVAEDWEIANEESDPAPAEG